jgi:hypothetical protein
MGRIKVLIPALALLMLFAVAPVMAAPPRKIPVSGTQTSVAFIPMPGHQEVLIGDIVYITGWKGSGTLMLNIWSNKPGLLVTSCDLAGTYNTITHTGIWYLTNIVWMDPNAVNTNIGSGTFEGSSTLEYVGTPVAWTRYKGYTVVYGTGLYEGETLVLSYEGNPGQYTGSALISRR